MRPSEVRRSVLADHEKLRGMLEVLEREARAALADRAAPRGPLLGEAKALLATLASHMSYEDRHLGPALRDADAWGDERCAQLTEDHREQRELLAYALEQLHGDRPLEVIARNLLDLIELLREDMQDEESAFLTDEVLRDDVVGVDVTTG